VTGFEHRFDFMAAEQAKAEPSTEALGFPDAEGDLCP
jgi:hypothetical protein